MSDMKLQKANANGIPVIYMEPSVPVTQRKLAIFLHGLGGVKEELVPYLEDIAKEGYIALAFDKYQHGERGAEDNPTIMARVFSDLRKYGWPILGQSILDTERVIDWAIETLHVIPEIYMGGISMGGDISIAVAGIDSRIVRVAPVVATPDWLRPGMYDLNDSTTLLNPGTPDSYAQFFYDTFNPITHLGRYVNCPPMHLFLGRGDTHIPPENAERFCAQLRELSPNGADNVEITYLEGPNSDHMDTILRDKEWWPMLKKWWLI